MTAKPPAKLKDGAHCKVIGGTHAGKSGVVRDIKTGKTGLRYYTRFAAKPFQSPRTSRSLPVDFDVFFAAAIGD
jgi:KOW motif